MFPTELGSLVFPFSVCFEQIYTGTACRVGCGKAECGGGSNRIHVCSFAVDPDFDFRQGTPCEDCPNTCSNNLCGKWATKMAIEFTRLFFNPLDNTFTSPIHSLYLGNVFSRVCFGSSVDMKMNGQIPLHHISGWLAFNGRFFLVWLSVVLYLRTTICAHLTYAIEDCKGKMCYNGGSLDQNTCTCTCPTMRLTPNGDLGEPLYTGSSCEIREWFNFNFKRAYLQTILKQITKN